MPIVDVRNIPTVVEFAPENKVVEFTEEAVTAEVVVGPTVVEFSWGELVPEPGLSGGGVFEGRVYIRPDIPTLPSNSEPVDPNADYLMLWDASSDTHVKVLANLGGGGGGDYTGVSLGVGADVYKETDDLTDPREHKFRSIKAGSNIVVTELAEEIEIAAGSTGIGGLPPNTLIVGSSDNGCGSGSTSFTPINVLPSIAIGDLMVWCMHIYPSSWIGSTGMLNIPTGWIPFMLPKYASNADCLQDHAILYKWVDSADLAGVTHTTSLQPGGLICSSTFAYRDIDPDRPFSTLFRQSILDDVAYGNREKILPPPAWGISSSQPLLMGYYLSRAGGSVKPWPTTSVEVGPVPDVVHTHALQPSLNSDTSYGRFATRIASSFEDENWIPSESISASLGGTGWTGTGIVNLTHSDAYTVFSATSAGRHYFEREVTLVAGKKYMFTMNFIRGGWNSAYPNMFMGLSFVDPSNVERGAAFVDGSLGTLLNPASDHGTSWHAKALNSHVSGVPNTAGTVMMLLIQAAASGTYKLRLNAVDWVSGAIQAFSGSGSEGWTCMGATFHENWKVPTFVHTGATGTFASNGMNVLQPWGWMAHDASSDTGHQGRTTWSTSLLPDWAQKPKARMYEYSGTAGWPRSTILTSNGEVVENSAPFGNVPMPQSSPTIPVYPSLGGARQKYYGELKWLSSGGYPRVLIYPMGGSHGHVTFSWESADGVFYAPSGNTTGISTTMSINDIIGVGIDFASSTSSVTVTLWKNGVQFATGSVACSASGHYHPDEPWSFTVYPHEASGYRRSCDVRVALHDEYLAYKPNGYVAWDPLYVPGARLVESNATGVKTISEGLAIDLTDTGSAVQISFDPTEVPNDSFSLAQLANMSTGKLLGRSTAGTGDIEELSVGSGLLLSGGTLTAPTPADANYYIQTVLGDGVAKYYTCDNAAGLPYDLVDGTTPAFVGGTGTVYNQGGRGIRGRYVSVTTAGQMFWPMGVPSGGHPSNPAFASCTLECWFKSTSSLATIGAFYNGAFLIGSDTGYGGNYIGLVLHNACRPCFGFGGGGSLIGATGTYNDGLWHHVVATRNHSTGAVVIYVDGAVYATGNCGAGNANSQPVNFWTGTNAIGLNGSVQHVAVYPLILTPLQVATHHAVGRAAITTQSLASYTGTLTGCATAPTATLRYVQNGSIVTLYVPQLIAVSNATTCTITGAPLGIFPARAQRMIAPVTDNGVTAVGLAEMGTNGTLTLYSTVAAGAFTAAGNKGTELCTLNYSLD